MEEYIASIYDFDDYDYGNIITISNLKNVTLMTISIDVEYLELSDMDYFLYSLIKSKNSSIKLYNGETEIIITTTNNIIKFRSNRVNHENIDTKFFLINDSMIRVFKKILEHLEKLNEK